MPTPMRDLSKNVLIICGVILLCAIIGVYGWLAIHKVDTTQFLYVVGTIVAPNLGIIFTLLKADRAVQNAKIAAQNTNGVMNKLIEDIPEQITVAVQEAVSNGENGVKNNAN